MQGDIVDYHLAASSGAGRKVGGMNLVQDEAIRHCIRRGAKLYHLGGGLKEKDTLATFKGEMANLELSYGRTGRCSYLRYTTCYQHLTIPSPITFHLGTSGFRANSLS